MSVEQGNLLYMIDLINRSVAMSLRTVPIAESLSRLRFDADGLHVVD